MLLLHAWMCLLFNLKCSEFGIHFKISVAYSRKKRSTSWSLQSLLDHVPQWASLAIASLGWFYSKCGWLFYRAFIWNDQWLLVPCENRVPWIHFGQPNPSEIQPSPEDILSFAKHAGELTADWWPKYHFNESPRSESINARLTNIETWHLPLETIYPSTLHAVKNCQPVVCKNENLLS